MKTSVGLTILSIATIVIACKVNSEAPAYAPQPRQTANPVSGDQTRGPYTTPSTQPTWNPSSQTPTTPTTLPSSPTGDGEELPNDTYQEYTTGLNLRYQLNLAQPVPYRVFQRKADGSGEVSVQFETPSRDVKILRVRIVDNNSRQEITPWQAFEVVTYDGLAQVNIPARAGGWYEVEAIMYDSGRQILARATVPTVGVGEVFVVAGQSNSTNCGSTPVSTQSDMVVSTDGQRWQRGNDPQIGTNDFSLCQGGSSWPAAGDSLVQKLQVPVAFASTGYSGTAVQEWLPNGSNRRLYEFTLQRMQQLGKNGFRAVLWHQGETDVANETTAQTYAQTLQQIIQGMQQALGWEMPWLVAEAAWCRQIPSYNKPNFEVEVTNGQKQVVQQMTSVYSGPNTDQFTEQYRSTNCHFNQQGAIATGRAWSDSIMNFLNSAGSIQ